MHLVPLYSCIYTDMLFYVSSLLYNKNNKLMHVFLLISVAIKPVIFVTSCALKHTLANGAIRTGIDGFRCHLTGIKVGGFEHPREERMEVSLNGLGLKNR